MTPSPRRWKTQRIALELKVWRRPTTEARGLALLGRYLDALGVDGAFGALGRSTS